MHEMRSILAGGGTRETLASKKTSSLNQSKGASLTGIAIVREESRKTNQRREDRHLHLADRAVIQFRRKRLEVTVVNVSACGVMIESDIEPRVGERIHISFEGCNRTQCTVRWMKGPHIGLEFAQETVLIAPRDVRELIVSGRREGEQPPQLAMRQQREPRQHLIWTGTLHHGCLSTEVRLHNISSKGALLDCGEDLLPGMAVVLELGGPAADALQSRIRWCRSGQIGICFDQPFDMRILANVQHAANVEPMGARYVKPDYLKSEGSPDSPWSARTHGLRHEDL